MNLTKLTTEQRNTNTMNLDKMTTIDILKTINKEDKQVAEAVENVLPAINKAVEEIFKALSNGARLFYVGAGTSGRLAVLDASECPPTFLTPPEMVQPVMAGGMGAFLQAVEGAEDDELQGEADLKEKKFTNQDVVIGITASGRTPYPIGALKYAQSIGAYTISISSNKESVISTYADCPIEVVVGPEILTGSTRMKAGTAHKMILNMISTTVMVKMGKVYENLMVDLNASNYKLKERAKHTVMEVTNVTYSEAEATLEETNYQVKPAIIMIQAKVDFQRASAALKNSRGYVREAITYLS
ncbi:N-acetylmuramic acid 6-phosphate etherase [Oceanobacillus piezotolerans]|uniref:N-acetylmuramic acid 6-phosphate etherase n=1 Tax=Oceanobacillus piezotolerans TaxID=2448030 RepID=A0A498DBN0_9BACI|nr:N-acetylmuramic acid 6-phosphate etherase [Oceanobacillus piezotolerans]RLL46978.1 N-acetylmuramic acid 6-phosphate etherase [Oceanobacillus piezotolerans]